MSSLGRRISERVTVSMFLKGSYIKTLVPATGLWGDAWLMRTLTPLKDL